MNRSNRLLFLIVLLLGAARAWAGDAAPQATLEVTADQLQPAGMPVVLTLTVRNSGTVPISYWCAGPAKYPDAADYRPINLGHSSGWCSNGQTLDDSGSTRVLQPGQSIRFPAALEPLDPGKYAITIRGDAQGHVEDEKLKFVNWPAMGSSKPIDIEIREDESLAAARETWMVNKVRGGDPFAQYLAFAWPRPAVRVALSVDIGNENMVAADRAAEALWGGGPPPDADAPLIADAITHHLKPPAGASDTGLLTRLLVGSVASRSVPLINARIQLAMARPEFYEAAINPLLRARSHFDLRTWEDRIGLGVGMQQEAALVGSLLELAHSSDPTTRRFAIRSLAEFTDNTEAVAGIFKAFENDRDSDVHQSADTAVRWISANRPAQQ